MSKIIEGCTICQSPTIEDIQRMYPSGSCRNCPSNVYSDGLQTCEKLNQFIERNINK